MMTINNKKNELKRNVLLVLSNITIEPIIVCFVLSSVMVNLAAQNLNMDKSCRVNLNFKTEVCDGLLLRDTDKYNKSHEVAVQKLVATASAWKNVIQSLVPCFLLLFMGSWSDRHKRRKPFFLLPIIGETTTCVGLLIGIIFYHSLPLEFNVAFEAIPTSLTGGWSVMFVAVFSYIAEITTVETRTLRIGAVNICTNLSYMVGNALSGFLLNRMGFYGIFSVALSSYLIGFFYGFFVVKDSYYAASVPKRSFQDFFDLEHIAETFKLAFKKDKTNRRTRIVTLMILCLLIVGPMHGELTVLYLFLRFKFGWNEIDYSIFSTFYVITHMFGTVFSLVLFSKILKIDDAALGILSSTSRILASLVYAVAPNSYIFYLGSIIEIFNGTMFIAMRSIMSKLVSSDELGKVNSLFGLAEAIVPIIYGPLYSLIYKYTISFFPEAFFLVGSTLTVPSVLIFCWFYKQHKRDQRSEMGVGCIREETI